MGCSSREEIVEAFDALDGDWTACVSCRLTCSPPRNDCAPCAIAWSHFGVSSRNRALVSVVLENWDMGGSSREEIYEAFGVLDAALDQREGFAVIEDCQGVARRFVWYRDDP